MTEINFDTVNQLIGEQVDVRDSQSNKVTLKISGVSQAPIHGAEWEAFSIAFNGDESFRIPQGSYLISHDTLGEQELFITAHGPTEYETVISRKR